MPVHWPVVIWSYFVGLTCSLSKLALWVSCLRVQPWCAAFHAGQVLGGAFWQSRTGLATCLQAPSSVTFLDPPGKIHTQLLAVSAASCTCLAVPSITCLWDLPLALVALPCSLRSCLTPTPVLCMLHLAKMDLLTWTYSPGSLPFCRAHISED